MRLSTFDGGRTRAESDRDLPADEAPQRPGGPADSRLHRQPPAQLEAVFEPSRAVILLRPLRLEILHRTHRPSSSSQIADGLGLSRQKVNYHVQELVRAGFLLRVGTRRKRNLIEQLFVASARAYFLAPDVLGPASPIELPIAGTVSSTRLQLLLTRSQSELATASRQAGAAGQRASTISLTSELRFDSSEERARFATALAEAVRDVVRRFVPADPASDEGETYRLVLGCHPVPADGRKAREDGGRERIE